MAQRLKAVTAVAGLQRQTNQRVIDAVADRFIEARADAHKDPAADQVENAKRRIKAVAMTIRAISVGTLWLGNTRS